MSVASRRIRAAAIGALLWLVAGVMPAAAAAANAMPSTSVIEITTAEAVRADWNSTAPPASGWTPVQLMDLWTTRWPRHDGVVWYRVHWQQADTRQPVGLLVDYVSMTGAIYVNGSLVARAPHLVEPLSRTWMKPQYILLDAPLLRQGGNSVLVRASGLAAYQPGLGPVTVGDPAAVRAQYERSLFQRFQIKLVNVAMSAVLGVIFLLIWLLRRQDTFFGWFALNQLAGSLYGYNHIASSPWPFASTDAWQAFNAAMWMAAGASYALFLLRYGERRFPRIERAMGVACVLAVAAALLLPGWAGPQRDVGFVAGAAFYYIGIFWFMWRALRVPRIDYRVLAACLLVPVLASFYDLALQFDLVRSDTYLLSLTSVLSLIGIAFALAYRLVVATRKVESFNVELQREVDAATTQLGDTLARAHALALANTRTGERLQLTRDLHDGFGGTLIGAIARLEHAPNDTPKAEVVDLLKEMRDDLRLVIDSTTREAADLVQLLAPLRHRCGQLLEAVDIDSYWHLRDIDGVEIGGARSLDLLRLLQEALTNVFKHSCATRVDVHVARDGDRLQLRVCDDGQGLRGEATATSPAGGAGFASMRLRAQRLGGVLQMDSAPGGTELRLAFPLAD